MPILLPKLIEETIDYYGWRNNIKTVNQEYNEKVTINTDLFGMTILIWCNREQIAILDIDNSINSIWYENVVRSWKNNNKKYILDSSPFVDLVSKYVRKPKNYFYSSAMNNESGYNDYVGIFVGKDTFIYNQFMVSYDGSF